MPKLTREEMNCDKFIGKLCSYRNPTPTSMLFLLLERTETEYDFPVYRVLYSNGRLSNEAAFEAHAIEEVRCGK